MTSNNPGSIGFAHDRWLTDTRVYNLIWLGRWIERAESMARAIDAVALAALANAADSGTFGRGLRSIASAWGVTSETPDGLLAELLKEHRTSSVRNSLVNARDNATQVAPLEFVQAMNAAVSAVEEMATDADPGTIHERLTAVLKSLLGAANVLDQKWFHGRTVDEEEIYRRFVQQQQQQQ